MHHPVVGDVARTSDYGGQFYLYHVAPREALPSIREAGLRPGAGQSTKSRWAAEHHATGRVFFTTQPEKWQSYFDATDKSHALLRVRTDSLTCVYDGGEWLYDGDEDDIIDGRLADCYTQATVPPEQIEILRHGGWQPLVRGAGLGSLFGRRS